MKQLIYIICDFLGVNAFFRMLNSNKAIIIWYHGICDDDFTMLKGYDERHIPKSLFRKQISYLKNKGYQFATMSELVDILRNNKKINKAVVLTFDDGFRNVIENGYPIMQELGAKGCFYLVANLISQQNVLWTDLIEINVRKRPAGNFEFVFQGKPIEYALSDKKSYENAILDIKKKLRTIPDAQRRDHLKQFQSTNTESAPKEFNASTWDQIRSLDKNILEAGSHTRHHPNCANLTTDAEFEAELKGSKQDIEKEVGYAVDNFCYPAGSYDERVIEHAKKYGYKSASSIIPGFNDATTPIYELRRIPTDENFWLFKAMVSGSHFFISRWWMKIKRPQ